MKKWGPFFLIFLTGLLLGAALTWHFGDFRRGPWRDRDRQYQFMIKHFSRKLDLTADQKEKITKIFDDSREKMKKLREESRPKFEALRQETRGEIRKILNTDQLKKFEDLEARWEARRKKRHAQTP
jgi:Spy/CpxP family protein refolding chaperone